MIRILIAIMLSFSLSSCASLNPLDVLNPSKPSLEVNAQVGKTNEQEKNNIKVESGKQEIKQEADKISNDNIYTAESIKNVTQNLPIEYLVIMLFLAGWLIPTPKETFIIIKRIVTDTVNIILITPVKVISSFILKLFGRE